MREYHTGSQGEQPLRERAPTGGHRIERVWLQTDPARLLLAALLRSDASVRVSLDLNLTNVEYRLPPGPPFPATLDAQRALLQTVVASPRTAFVVSRQRLKPIEHRGLHYLKLVPTDEAPTLECDGVAMHVVAPPGPFALVGRTLARVIRTGDRVLDTCGGLGYTALWALKLGAREVVSCEINRSVLRLRRLNPWSEGLQDHRLTQMCADAIEAVAHMSDDDFDAIIHDPPRISLGGNLYSLSLYRELARLLTPGGRLYHYTGRPFQRWREKRVVHGVARRLREAGFVPRWCEDSLGFLAWRKA